MKVHHTSFSLKLKQYLSILVIASMTVMFLPLTAGTAAAETASPSLMTDYVPTIYETMDESGFKHPGIGLTKETLENLQTQIRANKEPWKTYFNQMATSTDPWGVPLATKTVSSKFSEGCWCSQGYNEKFIWDGLTAYTQALMYVITGDEVYRANAMYIIRKWEQKNPADYAYFTDAHIHTGIPLYRMVTAAEIMRYTSTQTPELAWTDQDTAKLTNNVIVPVTDTFNHTNGRFMNQHLYPLLGSISGYIFTGNVERYREAVEWFTVNKTALDQHINGSILRLFRLVDTNAATGEKVDNPQVQITEMGRDQAHSTGDVINVSIISRLLQAQGTKVDPVDGTVSTAANAVTTYDFLGKRILAGTDYFARYMNGYDTPWIPTEARMREDGSPVIYQVLNTGYRGRIGGNAYDLYYYYKYEQGLDMEQVAPYYTEMFNKRTDYSWASRDSGGEYWLYIPRAAEAEGTAHLPKVNPNPNWKEVEDRFTNLDGNSTAMQEGDVSFVRIQATESGSKIALVESGSGSSVLGYKIRTNGAAKLAASGQTITLPDTQGQWRYVYSEGGGLWTLNYFTIIGNGTTVDIDHINVNAANELTPPVFNEGNTPLNLFTYVGSEAALHLDFSATDAGTSDVVTYRIAGAPEGAVFDTSTGTFSWKPAQAGTYAFSVEASDGTTVSTRDVTVTVANDRQSAVGAVIASYDANKDYIWATLDTYKQAYNEIMSVMNTATDAEFYQKLAVLHGVVQGLQLTTPLLGDGSINYQGMFLSAGFNTGTYMDNDPSTAGRDVDMDMGSNFRVSASAFGIQARGGFPERGGGITIYGSNDKENWTRLTPGVTPVSTAMNMLAVSPELQNEPFRFLKIEMIQKPYDAPFIELSEFHIFGKRHEVINKIASVSIGSDQVIGGRIVMGDTAKLSFQSTEAIQNVKVAIQGVPATVHSEDGLNWTAEAVMQQGTSPGNVTFKLHYQTAEGTDAPETMFVTDGSRLILVDESDVIPNVTSIAAVTDSNGRSPADAIATANVLFDNNPASSTDYRLNGNGADSWVQFDFGQGSYAQLKYVELLARQDGYYTRINGAVIQGSNDNTTWKTISSGAVSTKDWQILSVNDNQPYRYIRIINGNAWFGNMAEVRFHGVVKSLSKIASSSISSAQSVKGRIVPGNTAKLTFTSKEEINNVKVAIQGLAATVTSTDNINWTAEATLNQGAATGPVNFAITYNQQDGAVGFPIHSTTDNSTLFLVDESDLIKNVTSIANLIDSTSGRSAATTLQQVNALFDSNANTASDFRIGSNNSGNGSYITFDFKEGNQVTLSNVELLARQDQVARISGTVVQGSNDNTTWTTLTAAAVSTPNWQTMSVNGNVPYRYIRIYNGNAWFGNMAEVRFHGKVESLLRIQSASISSAQSIVNRIVPGNTVKLAIVAKEPIKDVKVAIQGQEAAVSSTDNINWTATATLNQGVASGPVIFTINYNKQDGTAGYPATQTTDNTSLYLVDESDVIKNVTSIANLIDSTSGRSAATTLQQVNALFDSNASTGSDFRIGSNNSGNGSYIIFDFKAGNQATLTSVELLARQDQNFARINGAVIQGSNDNSSWTTLTKAAVATRDWQTLAISSKVPYRYIKIVNPNAWFGNMNEVRFHGAVKPADVTPPVTTDDATQGSVITGNTVNLNAVDNSSGVAATYYILDGGTQQTGKTVTLTAEGTHTLVYWSVDWAGNVEQQHTVTVSTADTTPPVVAGLYADITVPTNQDVHVTIYYPLDAAVMEYKMGDNGVWTAYTAPVTVSENTTVYARSADAAGNISDVSSYTVSNIYKTAPSDAVFTADVTNPTNGNVTLTISYPGNAVVKEYKIGVSGTWTAYASPVTVTDNVTVYAQSKDFVGNGSNVTHYTVSNIDRLPPADAVLSADITEPTNQDVIVTISYPADAAVKEFKVGETGVWTAYGAPVVITDNSTVFARGKDAAGNVSNVTQYAVVNIDRIAPAEATLAVDTTDPTNQGVTVTITYPEDATVKEYKTGDSGIWNVYTGPVVVQDNDTVYARGTDAVGNVSNVTSAVVSNIWKTAPVTTATVSPAQPNGKNSWYTTDVTVSLSVYASVYGGAVTTEYQINDGDWTVYNGSVPAFGDGTYKVGFRSKDEAGNVEQLKTIEFKVDKIAPVLSVQLDKTSIWPPNHMMVPIHATLLPSDDGSGIESVVLTSITSNLPDSGRGGDIQAHFGTAATSFNVRAEKGSIYTITYTATDKAGNKTVRTATVTVPHDQSSVQ